MYSYTSSVYLQLSAIPSNHARKRSLLHLLIFQLFDPVRGPVSFKRPSEARAYRCDVRVYPQGTLTSVGVIGVIISVIISVSSSVIINY